MSNPEMQRLSPSPTPSNGWDGSGLKRYPLLPYGLALLGGVLMGLTPAPLNLWPLAWVAVVPLWVGVTTARSNGIRLALLWGVGYHGLALAWITGLHPLTWMGVPWLASVAIVLFCWAFITFWGAAQVALWAWSFKQLTGKNWPLSSGLRILIGTTLWCGFEWLWNLGPLDWTALSFTQSPHNLLILHLGQLSGPTGVTAAIVAFNGVLAEAWMQSALNRTQARQLLLGGFASLVVLHGIGFGLYSQPLPTPADTALKVGLIQGNIPTRIKLYAEGLRLAMENYTRGYEELVNQGVEAVLLPEGAMPFWWEGRMATENAFYQAVRQRGVMAWVGTFLRQGDRYTQSLITLLGNGEIMGRFDKIKLVPLGEYTPFQEVLGGLISRLSPIEATMIPGRADQTFDTPFGRAAVGICYESAFPQLFRHQVAAGAQFILTASNNDPYSRTMMAQHHAQDVMRAIETDRWSVRATNTGLSGIVDPHGRTQWLSEPNTYAIHAHTIYRRQIQTPYVRWGNWFLPLLLVSSAIGWGIQGRR